MLAASRSRPIRVRRGSLLELEQRPDALVRLRQRLAARFSASGIIVRSLSIVNDVAVATDPLLAEEHRAVVLELDQQRGDGEHRRRRDEQQRSRATTSSTRLSVSCQFESCSGSR